MPYMILAAGLASWPTISDWSERFGDISYGAYLYAFPLQQIISYAWGGHPPITMMLVASTAGALAFGSLSWRFVEQPALRWKPGRRRSPGREPSTVRVPL